MALECEGLHLNKRVLELKIGGCCGSPFLVPLTGQFSSRMFTRFFSTIGRNR
ncbi:hypothetical protein [Bacillus sp. OV166]|uniref:hypothetical protein n=1 Tax=Bacillus sp. OV166 TaxID=1882763 RepID=UPI0015C4F181|nr:hypothetical protein [Bacillus sp. OV166]